MGGKNAKALVVVNHLYPPETGDVTEIPGVDPAELAKEEENWDGYEDEDEAIDLYMDEVWNWYDKKQAGFLSAKTSKQFLKDALDLFALRKGKKPKEVLPQGRSVKEAIDTAHRSIAKSDPKKLLKSEFKDFVNMADLSDIMKLLSGEPI